MFGSGWLQFSSIWGASDPPKSCWRLHETRIFTKSPVSVSDRFLSIFALFRSPKCIRIEKKGWSENDRKMDTDFQFFEPILEPKRPPKAGTPNEGFPKKASKDHPWALPGSLFGPRGFPGPFLMISNRFLINYYRFSSNLGCKFIGFSSIFQPDPRTIIGSAGSRSVYNPSPLACEGTAACWIPFKGTPSEEFIRSMNLPPLRWLTSWRPPAHLVLGYLT